MSKFKLHSLSPLVGSTWSGFCYVLKRNHIEQRHYFKVALTSVLLFISSAFHCRDRIEFRKKVNKFVFKESPLFIIGHWRSGTTLLHNILTKDPASGFVTTYHAVFPNNLKSKWIFKNFMRLFMPSKRPGDQLKISVNLPQEDEYAMSNITHHSYYHFFYFPSRYLSLYKMYVRGESVSEHEEETWKIKYHHMVVKALINTNGRRAVLKNPVNTGRILKLLEIFPGANFIFIIRNPVIVYLSTKNFFTQLFPTLNLEKFSDEQISAMILDVYSLMLNDYLLDKRRINPKQIMELRFESFEKNTIPEIERIYNKFGFGGFEDVKPLFLEYLNEQNGHQKNAYTIEQQELDRVISKLDFAMKHWNYVVPQELQVVPDNHKPAEKGIAV